MDKGTENKINEYVKDLNTKFPNRPDDKYANEKMYCMNDVNQIVRQAIRNAFKTISE
jgi:hypothetical protein